MDHVLQADLVDLVKTHLENFNISSEKDIVASTCNGAPMMIKYGRESLAIYQLCFNNGIHLAVCDTVHKKNQIFDLEHIQNDLYSDDNNNAVLNEDDSDREDCFEGEDEANDVGPSKVEFENILNIQENIKNIRKIVSFFRKSRVKNHIMQDQI